MMTRNVSNLFNYLIIYHLQNLTGNKFVIIKLLHILHNQIIYAHYIT